MIYSFTIIRKDYIKRFSLRFGLLKYVENFIVYK